MGRRRVVRLHACVREGGSSHAPTHARAYTRAAKSARSPALTRAHARASHAPQGVSGVLPRKDYATYYGADAALVPGQLLDVVVTKAPQGQQQVRPPRHPRGAAGPGVGVWGGAAGAVGASGRVRRAGRYVWGWLLLTRAPRV